MLTSSSLAGIRTEMRGAGSSIAPSVSGLLRDLKFRTRLNTKIRRPVAMNT
jgi:hypothetical protein